MYFNDFDQLDPEGGVTLFLTPNVHELYDRMLALQQAAQSKGISAVPNRPERWVQVGDFNNGPRAMFRVAHQNTYRGVQGYQLRAVHGLELLDIYDNAHEQKNIILSRVRAQ